VRYLRPITLTRTFRNLSKDEKHNIPLRAWCGNPKAEGGWHTEDADPNTPINFPYGVNALRPDKAQSPTKKPHLLWSMEFI
jgi:hypothetical protein